MSGGWYCTECGARYGTLGSGRITCQRCGKLGLRGYDRTPFRVTCAEHPDWRGWDDGGVNDDLALHQRRQHVGGEAVTND